MEGIVNIYFSSIDDDKSQFAQITTGGHMSKYEYKKMYLVIYLCLIAL